MNTLEFMEIFLNMFIKQVKQMHYIFLPVSQLAFHAFFCLFHSMDIDIANSLYCLSNSKRFPQNGLSVFWLWRNVLSSVTKFKQFKIWKELVKDFDQRFIYLKVMRIRFASFDGRLNLRQISKKKRAKGKHVSQKSIYYISLFQWHDKHFRMDRGDQLCLHKTWAARVSSPIVTTLLFFTINNLNERTNK